MFSFLIIVLVYLLAIFQQLKLDVDNHKYRNIWHYVILIFMLFFAVFLRIKNM